MKIEVLFFGWAREVTGFGQERAEFPENSSVEAVRRAYDARFPQFAEMAGALLVSVNQEFAEPSHVLHEGDEVAFLPPVSGGAPEDFFRLTRAVIPTGALAESLKAPEDGAVVVFEGIVRNNSGGRKTLYLEYEAYEPMALRKMADVGREAKEKFPIDRIGMIHRLGRMEIGETSVAILVTSAHRRAAFEACRYAIDRLKQIVPIWKKEFFEDGSVWAEGENQAIGIQRAEDGAGDEGPRSKD
jgi:molybdopterin converting factor subunit 1